MLMESVTGIDDGNVDVPGEGHGGSRRLVPGHDAMGLEGDDVLRRVNERLPLPEARSARGEVQGLALELPGGDLEGHAGARRVLEKEVGDHPALQKRDGPAFGNGPAEGPCNAEKGADLLFREIRGAQEVFVFEGNR